MLFNLLASNCIKRLLIVYSRSAKVTSKQCMGEILISLYWLKLFKVVHSVERKISWIFFEFFFIQEVKDLMNAKLFLKNNMWLFSCTAYNCSNSNKNNPGKTFFILPKYDCTRKVWIAAIKRKEGTLLKNVYLRSYHFEEACFDKSWV